MKYFFIALSVIILFAACSKTTNPTNGTAYTLIGSKWQLASGTIALKKPNGADTILNYMNWIPYCHKDDYISFYNNKIGYTHSGSITCSPSDPDSVSFVWNLTNAGNTMSFTGFDFNYAALGIVLGPVYFDTEAHLPIVVLDTVVNAAAAHATGGVVVLDSTWSLIFDTLSVSALYNTYSSLYTDYASLLPTIGSYNAAVSSLSATSFTLTYSIPGVYLDSTGHHTGTPDLNEVPRLDTFHYTVTYNKL